ncbi:1-aminocyclopropane-1-carboxylate deaminase/D-cysteine desulfhydrase [Shewanella algae]|uniref:1-aminocyclopropane-1-carboxylate deaminase/D-cysteine desulfhydrase n=1 Tax=Shewanella algae TaxID=38313 RepID=UPI003AB09A01
MHTLALKYIASAMSLADFKLDKTPVQAFEFRGHQLFIKRDDLLHPSFSGNKARKFRYFLDHDFPGIKRLIGYGSAQANSLYSMAALAELKGWQLDFYVDHLPEWLQQQPLGNYRAALELGARVIAVKNTPKAELMTGMTLEDFVRQHIVPECEHSLFVPEGGRCSYAEYGVAQLGVEILQWQQQQATHNLKLFLPSGTGTTALFLQKYFCEQQADIEVLTCAVVGGDSYLKTQLLELSPDEALHPTIVTPERKYHFGKCYPEFYQLWQELEQSGIRFELLYDPLGWQVLLDFLRREGHSQVLYLHQGGLLGNESMLPRYRRKYG